MFIAELLEAAMLICFGLSWPMTPTNPTKPKLHLARAGNSLRSFARGMHAGLPQSSRSARSTGSWRSISSIVSSWRRTGLSTSAIASSTACANFKTRRIETNKPPLHRANLTLLFWPRKLPTSLEHHGMRQQATSPLSFLSLICTPITSWARPRMSHGSQDSGW